MKNLKWFLAFVGMILGRPRFAIIGFFLGALFEELSGTNSSTKTSFGRRPNQDAVDFELNLLKLSAIVIKADGNASQSELDFVRMEFVRMFGKERANKVFELHKKDKTRKPLVAICATIRQGMPSAVRLQLLHYLFKIAQADGEITPEELTIIAQIAQQLRIPQREFLAIKAMFTSQRKQQQYSQRQRTSSYAITNAYTILEITSSATDAEVKKAYRTLVKKYHPDKLQHLGKVHVKAAEEKFKKIQEAYETIRVKRGMK